MSQNDNATGWRSPAGWHEDAVGRDAGHDEMQAAVWRTFSRLIGQTFDRHGGTTLVGCEVEVPILSKRGGGILAFADVALKFDSPENQFAFIEVKPRVYSCGALIRQCNAIYVAGQRSGVEARVTACVYDDDPKLPLLRELYHDVMAISRETAGRIAA